MPHQIRTLLDELKTLVLFHPAVQQVHIRGEEATATRAYLQMGLILQSQDVVAVMSNTRTVAHATRLRVLIASS